MRIGPSGDASELRVTFTRIPAILMVRRELSKARHQYHTFLTAEACNYIAEYLTQRVKMGERLDYSSPLITPRYDKPRKNIFVRTTLLGDLIRARQVNSFDLRYQCSSR